MHKTKQMKPLLFCRRTDLQYVGYDGYYEETETRLKEKTKASRMGLEEIESESCSDKATLERKKRSKLPGERVSRQREQEAPRPR